MKKIISKVVEFFKGLFGKKNSNNVSPTPAPTPKIVQPPSIGSGTQYWYGRVNYWTENATLLVQEVSLMKSVGVSGYIIEMAGWGSSAMRQTTSTQQYKNYIALIDATYAHLLNLCRQNGLWLFCCIVNDNALSSKHGNKAVDPKHYYNDVAHDLLKIVLKYGPENVVVQPISELSSDRVKNHPGPAWQKSAISKLKAASFKTCNNDEYGRPGGYAGCNYKAWHPNKISHLPGGNTKKTNTFMVSDTGGIISELNGGANCDKVDANCKPSKVKEWRTKCKGFAVCGYYDFKRKSFNQDAIKAMGGK